LLEPYRDQLPPELFTQAPSLPEGGSWENRRKNIIEAAALLREAGYQVQSGKLIDPRTKQPVKLTLVTYSALIDRSVSLFLENLETLGISVEFRNFDTAQFRNRIGNFDYDMVITTPTFPPLPTPGLEMQQFWSSRAAETPRSMNYAGVNLPAVDAMLQTLGQAEDRQTVIAAMRAIDRILLWNYYAVPFQHTYPAPLGQVPITYWDRFGRPDKEPTHNFPFLTMEHWWVDQDKEARLSHGNFGHRNQN
jgi:microcin C transport system substrate-binding protein